MASRGKYISRDLRLKSLSVTTLTVTGLTATRVVFVGTGGLLTDDSGFTFNASTNALSVDGEVIATVTATTRAFVATASGGDRVQIIPNATGNGGQIRGVNNAQTDFEPLTFTGETIDLNYRTGVGTSTSGFTLNTSGNVVITNDLAVNGGDLTSSATIFNLLNATVTTLNLGSAVTTGRIMAAGGSLGIGSAASNIARVLVGGSFTSGGAGDATYGLLVGSTITGATGDTTRITHAGIIPTSTVTQGASETISVVSTAHFTEPVITVGTGDTVTVAATVYIASAPTEGSTNDALHVAAGTSRFLGNVITDTILSVGTTATVFNTVATTVNAFGAATTISIGASTGTTTINNDLTIGDELTVNGAGVSIIGGDLRVNGGVFGGGTSLSLGEAASTARWQINALGRFVAASNLGFAHGTSALATNATEGFLHIQSCAGAPTGTPASIPTGQIPTVYDSTNNRIYFYNGSWRSVAVA